MKKMHAMKLQTSSSNIFLLYSFDKHNVARPSTTDFYYISFLVNYGVNNEKYFIINEHNNKSYSIHSILNSDNGE